MQNHFRSIYIQPKRNRAKQAFGQVSCNLVHHPAELWEREEQEGEKGGSNFRPVLHAFTVPVILGAGIPGS